MRGIVLPPHGGLRPLIIFEMPNGAKRWIFTLNNYTDDEEQALGDACSDESAVVWAIFGNEVAPDTGTPHKQGAIVFKTRKTIRQVKAFLGSERYHLEVMRGAPKDSEAYCKKDDDWEEFGTMPGGGGDGGGMKEAWKRFIQWCKDQEVHPDQTTLMENWSHLLSRYPRYTMHCVDEFCPPIQLITDDAEPRDWQEELRGRLLVDAEGRKVMFVVDEEGASGKTWFCQWMMSLYKDVQVLGLGKRDDIAHQIDVTKRIFLFTLPRGCIDHLQYPVLEMLKDRMVVSPKYESQTKVMEKQPHVVVFTNEIPKLDRMTSDRYEFFTFLGQHFLSRHQVQDRYDEAEAEEAERRQRFDLQSNS